MWGYLTGAGTIVAFAAYIWLLKRVAPTTVATLYLRQSDRRGVSGLGSARRETFALDAVRRDSLVIGSVAGLLLAQPNPKPVRSE